LELNFCSKNYKNSLHSKDSIYVGLVLISKSQNLALESSFVYFETPR
jgi:hypothetical protein